MKASACRWRTGCDVVDIARLHRVLMRNGSEFADSLFSPAEQALAAGNAERFACLFAVKEAAMKWLGLGIGHGVGPRCFEIIRFDAGCSETRCLILPMSQELCIQGQYWSVDRYAYARCLHVHPDAVVEPSTSVDQPESMS